MKRLSIYAAGLMLFICLASCDSTGVSVCKQTYQAMTRLAVDSTATVNGYHSAAQAEADFRQFYTEISASERAEVQRYVSRCKAASRRRAINREVCARELNAMLEE